MDLDVVNKTDFSSVTLVNVSQFSVNKRYLNRGCFKRFVHHSNAAIGSSYRSQSFLLQSEHCPVCGLDVTQPDHPVLTDVSISNADRTSVNLSEDDDTLRTFWMPKKRALSYELYEKSYH